jgi:hypothetical protein
VVRSLCKFFQCLCLLVAPIVFLQLQQQIPISLKQIAFFAGSPEYQQFTIMSQCCLKSMLKLGMTIGQTPVKPFVRSPLYSAEFPSTKIALLSFCCEHHGLWKTSLQFFWFKFCFLAPDHVFFFHNRIKKAHAICSLKGVGFYLLCKYQSILVFKFPTHVTNMGGWLLCCIHTLKHPHSLICNHLYKQYQFQIVFFPDQIGTHYYTWVWISKKILASDTNIITPHTNNEIAPWYWNCQNFLNTNCLSSLKIFRGPV